MRILRLFVTTILEAPINWNLLEDDTSIESGTSTWDEISAIENVNLEIYLDVQCCSILHTNVAGIPTKRISDELILGMLEDFLVDDIDEVKPIILRIEDDTAYVAIFNKLFYTNLLTNITDIGKPVRFLQSFAYSTALDDGEWALFLSNEQQFLRTSKYEYFLVDNNAPLPLIVDEMLSQNKPTSIRLYSDNEALSALITEKYKIPCNRATSLEFGVPIWNFYNQKSTQFKIKLDAITKKNLLDLLKVFKTFSIVIVMFWFIDIIMVSCSIHNSESTLANSFAKTYPVKSFTPQTFKDISVKLDDIKHAKGLYSEKDAIPLFRSFLNVVPSVGTDSIIQINYQKNILEIFLNSNFNPSQFTSYQNILYTQKIEATIEDYKAYSSKEKKSQSNSSNPDPDSSSQQIDAAWVVTLKPLLLLDLKSKTP